VVSFNLDHSFEKIVDLVSDSSTYDRVMHTAPEDYRGSLSLVSSIFTRDGTYDDYAIALICYRPSVRLSDGWIIEQEAKLSLG